jgi:hypothetical protein
LHPTPKFDSTEKKKLKGKFSEEKPEKKEKASQKEPTDSISDQQIVLKN